MSMKNETTATERIPYTKEAYDNAFARARIALLNPLVRQRVEQALTRTGEAIARLRGGAS